MVGLAIVRGTRKLTLTCFVCLNIADAISKQESQQTPSISMQESQQTLPTILVLCSFKNYSNNLIN